MRVCVTLAAVVVLLACQCHRSLADYYLNPYVEANSNTVSPLATSYNLGFRFDSFGSFRAFEDGSPTDAFITLANPGGFFSSYANHPSGTSASYSPKSDASEVIDGATGNWQLSIEDGGEVYEYDVEVSISSDLTSIPRLLSTRLAAGNEVGDFDWSVADVDEFVELDRFSYWALLREAPSFASVLSETLPSGAREWVLPEFDNDSPEFWAEINALQFSRYDGVVSIESIAARTAGAPVVTFGDTPLEFNAEIRARLVAETVPEPSSAMIAIAGALLCTGVGCRSRDWRV